MEKSFINLLKKEDIVNILKINNLEINNDMPSPCEKLRDEDGTPYYFIKCKLIKDEEMKDIAAANENVRKLFINLAAFAGALGGSYYSMGRSPLIVIRDYYMAEILSTMPEEDSLEYNRELTKNYAKYMISKFGETYKSARKKYINKVVASERTEEQTR